MSHAELPPNTFQVPDLDDEEDGEEDEIAFVQETVLKSKIAVVVPPPSRSTQSLEHIYIEDEGQGAVCARSIPDPPPPSFVSSPRSRACDTSADSSSIIVNPSITASGPSGLTEAERQADKRALDLDDQPSSSSGGTTKELQSSAKNSSSLLTSSQTKQSDEEFMTKLKLSVDRLTSSTEPASSQKTAAFVDVDLTQSEADSDEAYSPDLMVDDSEDGQRRDTLTDYGSDSDCEALLMAEDRGTSEVFVAEDSTDSDSNRSEYSDDIGMERDEDFFDDTENKAPGENDNASNNVYNDSDKAAPEQTSIPYNMRPGNFTIPSTRLSLPSNPLNRAPSPSDAAMAKPCEFQTGDLGSPSDSYLYSNQQSWSNPMTSVYGSAWSCAMDGRNHAPYDDRFGGYQYPYGAGYAPGQFTSNSFRAYPSQPSMLGHENFNPGSDSIKQVDRSSGSEMPQVPRPSPISISALPGQTPTEATCSAHDQPKSTAKVSIDNIVQKVSDAPQSPTNDTKLKRKADEMISDSLVKPTSTTPSKATQPQTVEPTTSLPQSKMASIAPVKAFQAMVTTSHAHDGRPTKRARIGNDSRKTSFTTLAATALAGAIVGGVGVVAALVSLPQDFFV